MSVITNRHDILILFDVTNGNPNGDPDAGNMPRIDPTTNKGLVSDVCLKRKIRNFISEFPPERSETESMGYDILIQQGRVINNEIQTAIQEAAGSLPKKPTHKEKSEGAQRTRDWLCNRFYDVRAFGGVLSTGEDILKGSPFGQVRGPIQFTFARSCHPITPLEISITRCAVTKAEDESKERTMGDKHIVPYALYAAKAYVSPAFADVTKFVDADLALFFEALEHMFTHDQSAARAEMVVRGIYDFEHVGTQPSANAGQNAREAKLGCAHAHKLLGGIKINLKKEVEDKGRDYPESFEDYDILCSWTEETIPKGVVLHCRHEEPMRSVRFRQ